MGAGGEVALEEVWRMLEHCAPGHSRQATTHYWCVRFNGITYPRLPLGNHGRRKFPAVQAGHVRAMARHLGFLDCARGFIEGL
ncbi:hypothetical protein L6V77_26120 [Myxococcota bacterium]|nr:hypothetical protein [Myxococcota bacterium]